MPLSIIMYIYMLCLSMVIIRETFLIILKVNTVSWSADGSHLLSGSDDCHLNIYDALKRKVHNYNS